MVKLQTIAAVCLFCFGAAALAGEGVWTSLGPDGGRVQSIRANYTDSTVYAQTGPNFGSIYTSSDSGLTWSVFARRGWEQGWDGGSTVLTVTQTADDIIYAINEVAYRYSPVDGFTDFGSAGLASPSAPVPAPIALDTSADGQTIYVGTYSNGVYVSPDGGTTFYPASSGLPGGLSSYFLVHDIVADPNDSSTAYVSMAGSVYLTTNAGVSWSDVSSGLPSNYAGRLYVDSMAAGYAFTFDASGIYRNVSGGTWSQVWSGSSLIEDIAADPSDASVLYAIDADANLYKSSDTGASWSLTGTQIAKGSVAHTIAVVGNSSPVLLVGTDHGIWRSADGGASWSAADSGIEATFVHSIVQSPTDPKDIVLSSDQMGTFVSADGGVTFTPVPTTAYKAGGVAAWSPDSGTVYTTAGGSILQSGDSGISWTATAGAGDSALAIDPNDSNFIIASKNGSGVSISTNGGASWTASTNGLVGDETVSAIAIDPSNSQIIYLASYNHGIYKSTDRGASWMHLDKSPYQADFVAIDPADPSHLYSSNGSETSFNYSNDGGATWTIAAPPRDSICNSASVRTMAFDSDKSGIIYAGTRWCGVFRSVDQGVTWQSLDAIDLPFDLTANVTSVLIDSADHSRMLVADKGAGVLEYTAAVDISVTGGVDASVFPGDKGSMQFSITNQSDLDSADVQVTINLNSNLTVTDLQSTAGSCSMSSSVISCDLGAMAGKTSVGVSFSASAKDAGSYDVTATATPYEHELTASDDKLTLSLDVQAPSSGGGCGGGSGSCGNTSSSSSGGGGGGAMSWLIGSLLLGLAGLARAAKRDG